MIGVYCFKSKITGQYYVGSSVSIKRRQESHMKMLRRGTHHSWKLQKHYDTYGDDDLEFIVLERLKRNNLEEREFYYIELYNAYVDGFNCTKSTKRPNHLSVIKARDTYLQRNIDSLMDKLSDEKFGYGQMVVQTYVCEANSYLDAILRARKLLSTFLSKNKNKQSNIVVETANESWLSKSLVRQIKSDLSIATMVHLNNIRKEQE